MHHLTRTVLASAAVVVGLAACGADEDATPDLVIRGGETGGAMWYEPEAPTVEAGTSTIQFDNVGVVPHELSFEDPSGEIIATSILNGGEDATFDVDFSEPGTYRMICREPGHTQAGMAGTLTVTA